MVVGVEQLGPVDEYNDQQGDCEIAEKKHEPLVNTKGHPMARNHHTDMWQTKRRRLQEGCWSRLVQSSH